MKLKWNKDTLLEFELKVKEEFEKGHINAPIHLSGGNEENLISIFELIKSQDYVISTHRNHYHYLLKGGNPDVLMAEIKGEKEGCCKGLEEACTYMTLALISIAVVSLLVVVLSLLG